MTRFDLRLAFRLHRFEVIGFGALFVLLSIAAFVTAAQLDATGYGANCWDGTQTTACEAMGRAFWGLQQTQAPMVQGILVALPFPRHTARREDRAPVGPAPALARRRGAVAPLQQADHAERIPSDQYPGGDYQLRQDDSSRDYQQLTASQNQLKLSPAD